MINEPVKICPGFAGGKCVHFAHLQRGFMVRDGVRVSSDSASAARGPTFEFTCSWRQSEASRSESGATLTLTRGPAGTAKPRRHRRRVQRVVRPHPRRSLIFSITTLPS
ncbi:hypothetical protein ebA6084 [Aromatoleum aromaticum EbN1]|uniref:Uncharacterized protein n=1 Tax=Aromatoleum aromaticum (strain DSM 19018 / LMG 30748 / EbN1) TaxID=76114 RepID=Q5NZB7_AROAE|nr:hypothetical protein ebA6084 [Aromatoleum aromaticum EbN1]